MSEKTFIYNIVYHKEKWAHDASGRFIKMREDALFIFRRHQNTKTPTMEIVKNPTIDFYIVKEEFRDKYKFARLKAPLGELEKRTCLYSRRDLEVAKALGLEEEYKQAKRNNGLYEFLRNDVYNNPYIYGANQSIESYYKLQEFIKNDKQSYIPEFNIGTFDIEVDISQSDDTVTYKNPTCPINLITYFNKSNNTLYAFILNEPGSIYEDQVNEIKMNEDAYIKEYLYPDYKDNSDLEIELKYYSDEKSVIYAFFTKVFELKPEVMLAWNADFDISYIRNRCTQYLNIDTDGLFTHPEVPIEHRNHIYKMSRDRETGAGYIDRYWDYIEAPNYTLWICAMSSYSNLRKRYREQFYKLEYISTKVLEPYYKKRYDTAKKNGASEEELDKLDIDVAKLDLNKYDLNIRTACNKNFKIFLKYGLRDTYVLYRMDLVEHDLDKIMVLCGDISNISNVTSITVTIKDMLCIFALFNEQDPCILGQPSIYTQPSGYVAPNTGGLVSSPALSNVVSVMINGNKTFIYDIVCDYDASSMYPSIMIRFNMCKDTIWGTIESVYRDGQEVMVGDVFAKIFQTRDQSAFNIYSKIFGMKPINVYIKEFDQYINT